MTAAGRYALFEEVVVVANDPCGRKRTRHAQQIFFVQLILELGAQAARVRVELVVRRLGQTKSQKLVL